MTENSQLLQNIGDKTGINGETYTISQCIGEAIGLASMCWSIAPEGVFDSDMGSQVLGEVLANIDAYVQKRIEEHDELRRQKQDALSAAYQKERTAILLHMEE